jgi:putative nucleotidyltransferase with HDIG domain
MLVSKKELRLNIAKSLLYVAKQKDPYIIEHMKNVSMIAVNIAREMKLSKEQISKIKVASLLHDIGKILIPPEILHKPGKLNHMETLTIKLHVFYSYEILKKFKIFGIIPIIVLRHHERLDGSGYPYKLKDKDIFLESKILAVADVVEAMTFRRPYRHDLPEGAGIEEINNRVGILYDKDIVDAVNRIKSKQGGIIN